MAFKFFHFMPSLCLHIFFTKKRTEKAVKQVRRAWFKSQISMPNVQNTGLNGNMNEQSHILYRKYRKIMHVEESTQITHPFAEAENKILLFFVNVKQEKYDSS
jgi:hypothetical protein